MIAGILLIVLFGLLVRSYKSFIPPKLLIRDFNEAALIYEYDSSNHTQLLPLSIGSPPQQIKVQLSSAFCGLWVFNKKFHKVGIDESLSQSLVDLKRISRFYYVFGRVLVDTCFDSNKNKVLLNFLLVDSIPAIIHPKYDGILGLGNWEDTTNSVSQDILLLLKKQHLIQFNIFSVENAHIADRLAIEIGKMPKEIEGNEKRYRTCATIPKEPNWKCRLDAIYFDDEENKFFPMKNHISFGIGGSHINVPLNVFNYLYEKYFRSKQCKLKVRTNQHQQISCKVAFDPKPLGTISFIIGKWNFKIAMSQLFILPDNDFLEGQNKLSKFSIVSFPTTDGVYVSTQLLKGLTVFDKEKDQLGLYTPKQ